MRKATTKLRPAAALALTAFVTAILTDAWPATGQQPTSTNKSIPVIVMDKVRLTDAISNLAKMAGINYILDPRLSGFRPTVTGRWENRTAEQMLGAVLKEHNLTMIENPATSVARIVISNQVVKPVPANQVGNDTNSVIPLIVLDEVLLDDAIKHLAAQAHLRTNFDPKLLKSPSVLPTVSVRWQNLTARQALAAVLDNYDLMMVEDPTTAVARIVIKK